MRVLINLSVFLLYINRVRPDNYQIKPTSNCLRFHNHAGDDMDISIMDTECNEVHHKILQTDENHICYNCNGNFTSISLKKTLKSVITMITYEELFSKLDSRQCTFHTPSPCLHPPCNCNHPPCCKTVLSIWQINDQYTIKGRQGESVPRGYWTCFVTVPGKFYHQVIYHKSVLYGTDH